MVGQNNVGITIQNPSQNSSQDGVIKYKIESITNPDSDESTRFFQGFKELEAWRSQFYKLNLIGQYPDGIGYGNLSLRGRDGSFHITATQTGHLPKLDISDYPQVISYNSSHHSLRVKGSKLPSSEAPTHSAIYALSPDINTIFHIHSAQIWQYLLESNHLATSADVEYGTPEMAGEIARIYADLKNIFDHNVFVMAGHEDGVFAFGQNCDRAGLAILKIYNRLLLSH